MADDKQPPQPLAPPTPPHPGQEDWEESGNEDEAPASEADRKRLDEARKVWDRPEVQRHLQGDERSEDDDDGQEEQ